jgi:bifunctional DNA-binding transcriptional regulator/antitoxin component of YhaV-PrlF toxin-antitoxin module
MLNEVIKKIDSRSRIVIPKKMMDKINTDSPLTLFIKKDSSCFVLKNTTKLTSNIKIDSTNKLYFPIAAMDILNMQPNDKVKIYTELNSIIIKKII